MEALRMATQRYSVTPQPIETLLTWVNDPGFRNGPSVVKSPE